MAPGTKRPLAHGCDVVSLAQAPADSGRDLPSVERMLKDERLRTRHLRSRNKVLEIERDNFREDNEALQEQLNATRTQSMIKDGQIEQLEVSLDDSKIECQRVTTQLKQRDIDLQVSQTSKTVALELCMLHEQRAKDVEAELQQLEAKTNERDHRNGLIMRVAEDTRDHFKELLLATRKELEGVRTECEASRSVCESLGIECALKACDECQTYATLQLSCCGNFVCEPCVRAYKKRLTAEEADLIQTPETMTLLSCFTWCSHGRDRTDMSVEEMQSEAVRLHWIGCRGKTR